MRDILYTAKRTDDGVWVEGLITHEIDGTLSSMEVFGGWGNCTFYKVDPKTVSEYTGLFDKRKRRIFEGDIVTANIYDRYNGWIENSLGKLIIEYRGVVVFKNGAFGIQTERGEFAPFASFCNTEFEIIGNRFDNPELVGWYNE